MRKMVCANRPLTSVPNNTPSLRGFRFQITPPEYMYLQRSLCLRQPPRCMRQPSHSLRHAKEVAAKVTQRDLRESLREISKGSTVQSTKWCASDASLPSPGPPPGAAAPPWHPPAACLRTPCSVSSVLGVSAPHLVPTPHPARRRSIPHTPLARTMPFREMRTPSPPSRTAPFPRTQPSPLRLAPRRISLI